MIDSSALLKFVNEPKDITLNDIMHLENLTKKYPFFQLGYSLIAKGFHSKAPDIANDAIKKAATYALSRNALRKVIENEIDWVVTSTSKYSEKSEDLETVSISSEKAEIELIEAIANSNNFEVLNEQLKLIDQFIKNEPRINKINLPSEDEEVVDLSESSTTLSKPLFTESFAKILVKQARFKDATEVYANLVEQNPEKSTYFAGKIDEINKKYLID